MIYVSKMFHIPSSADPLLLQSNRKLKEHFKFSPIIVFHILQKKNASTNVEYFSKI
jgi:hypothetical protein